MLHIPVPCFGVETDPADRLEKYSGAVSPLAASMCLNWAYTTAVFCGKLCCIHVKGFIEMILINTAEVAVG
jgi:hypothetical protein